MATSTKTKKRKTEEKEQGPSEAEKVETWRLSFFMEVLPSVPLESLQRLVSSESSPHDARKLLAKGCTPNTVVEILS